MLQIRTYPLEGPETPINLPVDAYILDAATKGESGIVIYAMVDTSAVKVPWYFTCLPTGAMFNHAPGAYCRTLTSEDGTVWHVFFRR